MKPFRLLVTSVTLFSLSAPALATRESRELSEEEGRALLGALSFVQQKSNADLTTPECGPVTKYSFKEIRRKLADTENLPIPEERPERIVDALKPKEKKVVQNEEPETEELVADASEDTGNDELPALTSLFSQKGAKCGGYIKGSGGQYGAKGKVIMSAFDDADKKAKGNFENSYYEPLLGDSAANTESMKLLCPGFAHMNRRERKHFYVWVMASIAFAESKCGVASLKPHMDVTGNQAVGEFQLEHSRSLRKWRGQKWALKTIFKKQYGFNKSNTYCARKADLQKFEPAALCTMDSLIDQFRGIYGRPPGLVGPSQFAHLRRKALQPAKWVNSDIIPRIQSHPGCDPLAKNDVRKLAGEKPVVKKRKNRS